MSLFANGFHQVVWGLLHTGILIGFITALVSAYDFNFRDKKPYKPTNPTKYAKGQKG